MRLVRPPSSADRASRRYRPPARACPGRDALLAASRPGAFRTAPRRGSARLAPAGSSGVPPLAAHVLRSTASSSSRIRSRSLAVTVERAADRSRCDDRTVGSRGGHRFHVKHRGDGPRPSHASHTGPLAAPGLGPTSRADQHPSSPTDPSHRPTQSELPTDLDGRISAAMAGHPRAVGYGGGLTPVSTRARASSSPRHDSRQIGLGLPGSAPRQLAIHGIIGTPVPNCLPVRARRDRLGEAVCHVSKQTVGNQ